VIGWLAGRALFRQANDAVVVDVAGVGYEVHVASSDDVALGEPIELFVYTVVRADAIILFGFETFEDRAFFELLLVTPGVGPSTALGALRTMSVNELAMAIENDDAKRIAQIPGIGPKTASRIVLELKGKVMVSGTVVEGFRGPLRSSAIEDALRGLGYSAQEIRGALADVELPDDESTALREALHLLRRQ
jgi:Holliday junction DNA helicase RuvA